MAGIISMNWVRTPTALQQAAAWHQRHVAANARGFDAADAFVTGFIKAHSDGIEELAELVAVAALERIEAEAAARSDIFADVTLPAVLDTSV
jgi:hypothetical protein